MESACAAFAYNRAMPHDTVDLNLLRVFEAIARERSVTAAASVLGLSQPAVSNALARLRKRVGDPLFTRTPEGMQPTALAKEVAGPIRQALGLIDATLDRDRGFDPAVSDRTFRVHMSDIGEMVFLPPLMERLGLEAPQVRIETAALPEAEIADALASGGLDVAIGFLPGLGAPLRSSALFRDRYLVLVRRDHPRIGERLTRRAFAEARHCLVQSIGSGHAVIEEALRAHGLERRIALRVRHFTVVPMILARTDLVVSVPSQVAPVFAGLGRFRALPLPVAVAPAEVRLYWHERASVDPGNRWLRGVMTALFRLQGSGAGSPGEAAGDGPPSSAPRGPARRSRAARG